MPKHYMAHDESRVYAVSYSRDNAIADARETFPQIRNLVAEPCGDSAAHWIENIGCTGEPIYLIELMARNIIAQWVGALGVAFNPDNNASDYENPPQDAQLYELEMRVARAVFNKPGEIEQATLDEMRRAEIIDALD